MLLRSVIHAPIRRTAATAVALAAAAVFVPAAAALVPIEGGGGGDGGGYATPADFGTVPVGVDGLGFSFEEPRTEPVQPEPGQEQPPYNGCTAVPDSIRGVFNFTEACNRHDICYTAALDRKQCDDNFLRDGQDYCRRTYGGPSVQLGSCLSVAGVYYEGLRLGAGPWFGRTGDSPVVPGSEIRVLYDSAGNSHGYFEFRPDGTQVFHTGNSSFELNTNGTAWILDDHGNRVGLLQNFTLRQDASGNIIGIRAVGTDGTSYNFSTAPTSGTIVYSRDNSTGTSQTFIYDAGGRLTYVIDSRYGVINPNDGWGGFNPFSAAIQNPAAALGIPGWGGSGGWGGGGGWGDCFSLDCIHAMMMTA